MEEVTTPEALTDEVELDSSVGEGAEQSDSITLASLRETLGKDFKDVDGALKSLKDTYSYVGSQAQYREKVGALATALGTDEAGVLATIDNLMQEINEGEQVQEVTPESTQDRGGFVSKEQYQEDMFFSKHDDISTIREELSTLKERFGSDQSWDEFVGSERAQKLITPINGYREMEAQKSVLESNPRIGSATDKLSDAQKNLRESQERANAGDVAGSNQAANAAREGAVGSVIEAYGLN
jgi:hypothetical protein